jgi:hypothetical protein
MDFIGIRQGYSCHTGVSYRTSWISGGGGGSVSESVVTPALELPEATLALTHLKKPENAVESSVSAPQLCQSVVSDVRVPL